MVSAINLLGVVLYCGVMVLCIMASRAAGRAGRPPAELRGWLICAGFFACLAVARIVGLEDLWRAETREYLVSHAEYADRRALQRPLLGIAMIVSAVLIFAAWRVLRRNMNGARRYLSWAQMAMIGFVPLYAMRLVSFHFMDRILYRGPVKLNWLLDGGLTALAAFGAFTYIRYVMQAPQERGRQRER